MFTKGNNGPDVVSERLTGKQAAFVEHWIGTRFNGTRAAKLAGYAGDANTLAQQASINLRKPKIQRAIADRLEGHGGSAVEVITQLLEIARFSNPAAFMAGAGELNWKAIQESGHLVQSVQKTRDGWRIATYSRLEALKELARILKAAGVGADGDTWAGEVQVTFLGLAEQMDKPGP